MGNKTVLITGASRGIGLATAKVFLDNSYQVIGTSTSGKLPLTNPNLQSFRLDLSDENSINNFCQQLLKDNIHIDFLINNAAIMVDQEETVVNISKLRQTLEVNLIGTIDLTEKLLPLIKTDGVIINLSSALGSLVENLPNKVYSYRISKTALNMYTRTLARRLTSQNIKVYSFAPGWVKTDMGTIHAPREAYQPAQEILDLCLSDSESGLFYEEHAPRDW